MASKTKKKGKTMALTDFLAGDSKLVTVRGANWSEIVDNEEAETKPVVVDIGGLPTAPRASSDIDYSNVPHVPPFIAHIANLSFEIDDESLRRIFADLNPKAARIIKDGQRSRGIGLVEFDSRENLIEGLKKTDKEVYGRKIRVNVSDKPDLHQTDGGRGGFNSGHRSNRPAGGEDRAELAGPWKRAEPRSDEPSDDRQRGGFNSDRNNRNDQGRSSMGNGPRDNRHGNDFGFGYPRARDERGGAGGGAGGGGRDYNRQGQRNRYQDDDNRSNSGAERPRYGGRFSDTRDTRERNRPSDETPAESGEPPRERQRLQLQPRTKPLEEFQPLSGSSSSVNNVAANAGQSNPDDPVSPATSSTNQQHFQDSSVNENPDEHQQQDSQDNEQPTVKPSRGAGASIFGGAKPVDTAAKELEIEKKLKELQVVTTDPSEDTEEKKSTSRPSYNRPGDRDTYRAKRSSHNDEQRERRDEGRSGQGGDYHHRREYSGGRQYEDEGRRRQDDDHHHPRRGGGGGQDRDRYGGPSRRDNDFNRSDRDTERGNYRNRNQHTNEHNNQERSANNNNNFDSDSQLRQPTRGVVRRTVQTEDVSNKLQLSNKFGMLDDENLDDDDENEDAQSPSIDE